ncbi:MAG: hypothetical protein LBH06_10320 [Rikenellaceae bacterium]|nr:hypothetical protein [Rikenellaceae bacterium]
MTLYGGSPTLLLDMDESMEAYLDQSLFNIVGNVLHRLGSGVEAVDHTRHKLTIPYAARYGETSWNFISRMAASCGEWLFYDGSRLVVGNPNDQTEVRATFDMELKQVRLTSQLMNLNRWMYDYDYRTDRYLPEMAEKTETGHNSYSRIARRKSERLFPHNTMLRSPREVIGVAEVGDQMKAQNSRRIQQMSVVEADSDGEKLKKIVKY